MRALKRKTGFEMIFYLQRRRRASGWGNYDAKKKPGKHRERQRIKQAYTPQSGAKKFTVLFSFDNQSQKSRISIHMFADEDSALSANFS